MTGLRRTSPTLISLLIAVVALGGRLPSFADSGDKGDPWKQMLGYLHIMRTGEPAQKRSFADEASLRLAPLFGAHDGHDEADVQVILDEVRDLLRLEKDDFVSWTMLNDLRYRYDKRLAPLFLDALRDVSPNLKWSAIRWFSHNTCPEAVPDLEFAWRHETRPWVRSDLIAALALQGCAGHIEEFISIARGDDAGLAEAAIDALSELADSRAVPVIVSLTKKGSVERRRAALEALASWPGSADALDALLLATRSEDPSLEASAVGSLGWFGAPRAADRLEKIFLEEDDPIMRSSALEGLSRSDPARAVPHLIEVLHRAKAEDDDQVKATAARALMDIDDPATFDAVSDLDPAADPSLESQIKAMLESLGRDRWTKGQTTFIRLGCSFPDVITDPANPSMRMIVPPPWLRSVRCWKTPGFAGDPEDFPRMQAGTPVRIEDRFEWERRSWVRVTTRESDDCWVPIDFIGHPSDRPGAGDLEADMQIRREFDLPAGEVESDVARGLMDAGLLEVIEPGEEVIGVAISIDPEDFDSVLLLARSCGTNETMLEGEIYEIVSDLAPLYRGHPVLDRFRRNPAVAPGENDEAVDLEIEELSDR